MLELCMWVSLGFYNLGVFLVVMVIFLIALSSLITLIGGEIAKIAMINKIPPTPNR